MLKGWAPESRMAQAKDLQGVKPSLTVTGHPVTLRVAESYSSHRGKSVSEFTAGRVGVTPSMRKTTLLRELASLFLVLSVYTCLIKFTVLTLFCSCPHVIDKCQAVSWKSSRIRGKYTATETSPKTLTLVYLTDIVTNQTEIYKTTSKERTRSEEGQQRKSF